MKKIFILLVASACMVTFSQAQTGTKPAKKDVPKKEVVKKATPAKPAVKPAPKVAVKPAPAKVKTTPPPPPPAQHLKKDGTPDKRFKENQHLKKDGTPDKRFKENKPVKKS